MQNKEFDKLVESFLTPKTKLEDNSAFSLASLLSLVEEMEKTKQVISEVSQTSVLPTVGKEDKKYGKEPEEVTKFFQMFQSVLSKNVLDIDAPVDVKIRKLIEIVNYLKQNKQLPTTTEYLSKTFSIILFVGSLNNMIGNITPDIAAVAGNFYEKFISLLCKGNVVGPQNKIADIETDKEFISLKLVKDFSFTGSISNMIQFFTDIEKAEITPDLIDKDNGKILTVIISIKQSIETGKIQFYSYRFGLKQFIDMLGKERIDAYNVQFNIRSLLLQIADLKNKKEQLETVPASMIGGEQSEESNISDIDDEIIRLQALIRNMEIIKPKTQFDISKSKLDTIADKFMTGDPKLDVLSMSPEEKESIIEANKNIFNQNIKAIIEESNAVYYKINNFLLSDDKERKVNATEAYNSVTKLETNLVEYTK